MTHAELSVSNICWTDDQDPAAFDTLQRSGVSHIDIAPTKVFPEIKRFGPEQVDRDGIERYQSALGDVGLDIVGLQSLTFGRSENFMTGTSEERNDLKKHMRGIIRLGALVGAHTIVYGSGGTRIYEQEMSSNEVSERAADFFAPLDEWAREEGVTLGIEPVSTTWTKGKPVFGRTAVELINFLSTLQQNNETTNTKLVVDTFAMYDGGDEPYSSIARAAELGILAPHMQIAEPGMVHHSPSSPIDHASFSDAYREILNTLTDQYPNLIPTIAIEMFASKAPQDEAMRALEETIKTAQYNYETAIM